jgi:thiosulfate reductase cytochrome b subunit
MFAGALAVMYALIWILVASMVVVVLFSVIVGNHRIRKLDNHRRSEDDK